MWLFYLDATAAAAFAAGLLVHVVRSFVARGGR